MNELIPSTGQPHPGEGQTANAAQVWRAKMAQLGKDYGSFAQLGRKHFALFVESGMDLVVTFDNAARLAAMGAKGLPLGTELAQQHGFSTLTFMSAGQTWFRDSDLFAYIDRLVDEGFFDSFKRVVFCGLGPVGGYAAAALSIAAPQPELILTSPVASLAPKDAPFETRFSRAKRLDFSTRFGFAPEMSAHAKALYLIFDPATTMSAAHAALYRGAHVTKISLPRHSPLIERLAMADGGLGNLVLALEADNPTARLRQIFRDRARADETYLVNLAAQAKARSHPKLAARAAGYTPTR